MIEQVDPHDLPGLNQSLRDRDIFRTGRLIAGRMVVGDDNAGGTRNHRIFKDLTGMDDRRAEIPD